MFILQNIFLQLHLKSNHKINIKWYNCIYVARIHIYTNLGVSLAKQKDGQIGKSNRLVDVVKKEAAENLSRDQ